MLEVSVIIPVYNAQHFVRFSVESALVQQEVEEVILIEDGSSDHSLEVCKELALNSEKVVLLRHPGGKNCGAGASRNLGIQHASSEWIAFLDADDFYLPNRFEQTQEIAASDSDAGAIGEAVGAVRQSAGAEAMDFEETDELTTVTRKFATEEFRFAQAPLGSGGYICTDGWTVRKRVFEKTGLFNPKLRLHQDTELFAKFPFCTKVAFGEISKPVAMRRWHGSNRISALRPVELSFEHRLRMWVSFYSWLRGSGDTQCIKQIEEKIVKFIVCGQEGIAAGCEDFPMRKIKMILRSCPSFLMNELVRKYYLRILKHQVYSGIFGV